MEDQPSSIRVVFVTDTEDIYEPMVSTAGPHVNSATKKEYLTIECKDPDDTLISYSIPMDTILYWKVINA